MDTHYLQTYRDRLNALIGPLEEIEAKIDTIITEALGEGIDLSPLQYAGVTGAKIEIANLVHEIDDFEPEVHEADSDPDLDDATEDEDDEEFVEDELAEGEEG